MIIVFFAHLAQVKLVFTALKFLFLVQVLINALALAQVIQDQKTEYFIATAKVTFFACTLAVLAEVHTSA